MTDNYKQLRDALAAGPTPGPWQRGEYGEILTGTGDVLLVGVVALAGRRTPEVEANTGHIRAANPDTIRALLAERDALREALRWIAAVLQDAAGSPYCVDESGVFAIEGESRTMTQILDAADAALAQHQGEKHV